MDDSNDQVACYGKLFVRRIRSLGIRDRTTSPCSPWQNGYAERLIGSIRRECLDHVAVFGERHLRHLLLSYLDYYNRASYADRHGLALSRIVSPLRRPESAANGSHDMTCTRLTAGRPRAGVSLQSGYAGTKNQEPRTRIRNPLPCAFLVPVTGAAVIC